MASRAVPAPDVGAGDGNPLSDYGAATQRASWRRLWPLSSGLGRAEQFLVSAQFDRAPWLAVLFGCGIAAWFGLPRLWQWLALIAAASTGAGLALVAMQRDGRFPYLRIALASGALAVAAGCGIVWTKSALLGTPGISRPLVGAITGQVLAREDRPADNQVRLIVAARLPGAPARIARVRIKLNTDQVGPTVAAGAQVRVAVRLMPPSPPMLPGGHDFAQNAWFDGIAATGTAQGPVMQLAPSESQGLLAPLRRAISRHITSRLEGSGGGIASALASGDRGAIARADENALRDAGLSHLLSVSGLHVSAVVGASYVLAVRLLALFPWLVLRVRAPLWGSAAAALAGVFYTLLTGAEVPTVRSMVGALLVLGAVALGREPLSLRLLALAAFAVMLLWPEAVMGPSFQLSFGAVLAIIAFDGSAWMRAFTGPREEPWWLTALRKSAALLLTGLVVELALMPIGLFHFHRAGLYGVFANVIAIPLTTFVTMPAVAGALALDLVGLGAPLWWLAARSLDLLLWLARTAAAQPGAVAQFPAMGSLAFALFLAGGLWLALWQAPVRRWGLAPIAIGALWLALLRPPDVLVSGDGRHVALTGLVPERLVLLRDTRSGFARDSLAEMAASEGDPLPLDQVPGARCNGDFCAIDLRRGGRTWRLLLSRGSDPVPVRDLAAACERADLVVADRRLPAACRPALLKADRASLARSGGLAIDLAHGRMTAVQDGPDDHGWRPRWREQAAVE